MMRGGPSGNSTSLEGCANSRGGVGDSARTDRRFRGVGEEEKMKKKRKTRSSGQIHGVSFKGWDSYLKGRL